MEWNMWRHAGRRRSFSSAVKWERQMLQVAEDRRGREASVKSGSESMSDFRLGSSVLVLMLLVVVEEEEEIKEFGGLWWLREGDGVEERRARRRRMRWMVMVKAMTKARRVAITRRLEL